MKKKPYSKPTIISESLQAGVFGCYGSVGKVSMISMRRTKAVINFKIFCCEVDVKSIF